MPYGYKARGPLALPGERCAPCRAEGLMWEVMGHWMIGSSPGGEERKASPGRGTSLRPGNRGHNMNISIHRLGVDLTD